MTTDDLDAIKQENYDDSDPCLREILKKWLRQEKVTRQALIDALQSEIVGYPDIATSLLSSNQANDTGTNAAVSNKAGVQQCSLCGNSLLLEHISQKCSGDSCCLETEQVLMMK